MYEYKEKNREHIRNSQDEIDLYFVYSKVRLLLKGIKRKLSDFLNVLFKYKWLMLTLTLIGGGIGYFSYKTIRPYFTSSMTLVLAEIRNQFVENQLQRLSVMIQEDNYSAVAEDLEISINVAKQIKEMRFSNLDQDIVAEDSVLTGSPFEVELTVYNSSFFNSLEPAIANYLESNRYFSKQKRIRQKEIESMITKLEVDIEAIDSVKSNVTSPQGPVNGFVYGSPIDPTNLFRESISMYRQQVELEGDLEQLDNIQIVNGFAPRLRPTGPNLLNYLAIGGGLAFLASIPVAFILERRRRKLLR